jgi:hypothetical protein
MNKSKIAIYIIATAIIFIGCAGKLDIHTIETSLNEIGGAKTLERYYLCDKYESSPYQKIASGDPEWIKLSVRLLDFSDACYTEGIQASLGQAMESAPEIVLPYVNKSPLLSADRICLPFISDEQSIEDALIQIRNVKNSIANVKDDKLSTQQNACLEFIENIERQIGKKK